MKKSSFGCHIGHVYYGSLAYADDIILMSPTILGTHKLLSIADHFGKEFNISFNADKTKFLDLSKGTNRVNNITFNNNIIQTSSSAIHLGNWIGENSSDQNIELRLLDFNSMVNYINFAFKHVQYDVKLKLFSSYCMFLYGSNLWDFTSVKFEYFCTQWRKAIRKILGVPYVMSSNLFHVICDSCPIDSQLILRFLKFMDISINSDNYNTSLCCKLALQGSGSSVSNNILLVKHKYSITDAHDIYKKVKTMIYSGENDWHDYIIGNLVRETIHVRDYETTELSRDQLDCILQYIAINY